MKFIITSLIKFYRKHISPHFPARCKYYPTCSRYALDAIERFGAFKGSLLALWRLLRCNPWSMGGVDFVPDKFTFRVEKYDYFEESECDSHEFHNSNSDDDDNDKRY